jgi:hypothetical protein
MDEFFIERLSAGNLLQVKKLYELTYSKKMEMASLLGKYNTRQFGAEWLGFLAFTRDHTPAAFYGLVPCHFSINNEKFLAAQSVDTMTHHNHRKKGLFQLLAEKTYALARSEGIQFIFGFPNQNSYPGFVKLNWKFLATPMQLFIIRGSSLPVAAFLLKIPGLKNLYQKFVSNNFPNANASGHLSNEHGVIRDALFFGHKNQYTQTITNQEGGCFFWMKNDGALKIGLVSCDEKVNSELIANSLTKVATKLGCRSIILMTSHNSRIFKKLSKTVTPRDTFPIGFYNLTDRKIDFELATFDYCDIDIF